MFLNRFKKNLPQFERGRPERGRAWPRWSVGYPVLPPSHPTSLFHARLLPTPLLLRHRPASRTPSIAQHSVPLASSTRAAHAPTRARAWSILGKTHPHPPHPNTTNISPCTFPHPTSHTPPRSPLLLAPSRMLPSHAVALYHPPRLLCLPTPSPYTYIFLLPTPHTPHM